MMQVMWLLTMTIMLFIMINCTITITYHNKNFVATNFSNNIFCCNKVFLIIIIFSATKLYVREREREREREVYVWVSTKSVREARDRGVVKPMKRNTIVFDIPIGFIEEFWGYQRSYSNCNADPLHASPTLSLSDIFCYSNNIFCCNKVFLMIIEIFYCNKTLLQWNFCCNSLLSKTLSQ